MDKQDKNISKNPV